MKSQTLLGFSKFCMDCVLPKSWAKVQRWANKNGFKLDIERTTYHPKRHAKATELWGGEDYSAFFMTPKGFPISIREFANLLTEEGEWRDDLQGLRRTKEAFGQTSEVVATKKTKKRTRKSNRKRKGVEA